MDINEITYKTRGAIFAVFNELGPGLLESVYEAALTYELTTLGLKVRNQVPVPVIYKEVKLDIGFRLDLIVEEQVIVEIKSVELMHNVHKKQLLTYLRLSNKKLGLLVNFNSDKLIDKEKVNFNSDKLVDKESIIRIIN
jgi:GxxExxY protein